jgi:hypothetical protein
VTVHLETYPPEALRPTRLWFGTGGAIVIWALHLLIAYILVAVDCIWLLFPFTFFGLPGIRIVLLGLTILAVIGIIASGWVAFRHWRDLRHNEQRAALDPMGRQRFMLFSGLLLSGLCLLGMIWVSFSLFLTKLCE